MCEICKRDICPPKCPNYKPHKIGLCDKCGKELYADYEIWTDVADNKFCSEECARDFYEIKEVIDEF